MKGVRDPLVLVASGLFLCAFLTPFTAVFGFAGIALGMRDLRRSRVAMELGWSSIALSIAAWFCCASWVLFFFHPYFEFPTLVLHAVTIGGTGLALSRSARAVGARSLESVLIGLCWIPIAVALMPLLPAPDPELGIVLLWTIVVLPLAIAALRLSALAGRFHTSSSRENQS
jgi:hypothetical protein